MSYVTNDQIINKSLISLGVSEVQTCMRGVVRHVDGFSRVLKSRLEGLSVENAVPELAIIRCFL